jgi:hypothetical protein
MIISTSNREFKCQLSRTPENLAEFDIPAEEIYPRTSWNWSVTASSTALILIFTAGDSKSPIHQRCELHAKRSFFSAVSAVFRGDERTSEGFAMAERCVDDVHCTKNFSRISGLDNRQCIVALANNLGDHTAYTTEQRPG